MHIRAWYSWSYNQDIMCTWHLALSSKAIYSCFSCFSIKSTIWYFWFVFGEIIMTSSRSLFHDPTSIFNKKVLYWCIIFYLIPFELEIGSRKFLTTKNEILATKKLHFFKRSYDFENLNKNTMYTSVLQIC